MKYWLQSTAWPSYMESMRYADQTVTELPDGILSLKMEFELRIKKLPRLDSNQRPAD